LRGLDLADSETDEAQRAILLRLLAYEEALPPQFQNPAGIALGHAGVGDMTEQNTGALCFSASFWRDRVNEARSLADQMREPKARKAMQSLEATYGRMADSAAAREAREHKFD
jgi:hypothetical protein